MNNNLNLINIIINHKITNKVINYQINSYENYIGL